MPSPYSGKVYSFDHNWIDPVIERIGWLTSVLRKRDGSEQRIRLRNRPRRAFDYTAFVGGQDELDMRRRFDALLWSGQDQEIMVPFWPDAFTLGSAVSAGASVVSVAADLLQFNGRDIDNGEGYLMFWRDYKTYEVVKVNSITFNIDFHIISLDTNMVNTWPAGTVIVPARRCLHAPALSGEVYASDLKSLKTTFQVITPTAGPTVAGRRALDPGADVYRSTDVLANPGMDGNNTSTLERVMAPIDFQVGQFHNDSIQTAPFGSIDINIDLSGRTEIAPFLGWLNTRQGRQKGFWLPTWEQDFESVIKTAAAQFTATSFGYTAAYNHKESRRDIAFIKPDGTMLYRRITASSDGGALETFTVDTNLPGTMPSLDRTSFLRYCRLDQDEVQMNWLTTDDVTAQLKARELIKTA